MTYDPRKDIVDTCNISTITFTDDNQNSVSINLGYEEDKDTWDNMSLPGFVVRGVRTLENPTSVGWDTYKRAVEFDISFYLPDDDDYSIREDKREVMDALVSNIKSTPSCTQADYVRVTQAIPENDFDRKRNIYGFTATIEAVQLD